MKKLFTLLLLFFTVYTCGFSQVYVNVGINQPAQLLADAGNNQAICPGDTVTLGGAPAAIGGTPAYSYAWTGGTVSDSTLANPDANPSASGNFYLMITDSMGCTAYDTVTITVDTCVGISDPLIPVDFTLYPNPSDGNFKAILNGEFDEDLVLTISGINGQLIETRNLGSLNGKIESEFSLPAVSKGVYLVRLKAGNQSFVRRLIIQ